jgi:hypothetical protein
MPQGTAVAQVESKLKSRYGSNKRAIYGTLNKIGLMHGSKVTKKGMKKPRMLKRSAAPRYTAIT